MLHKIDASLFAHIQNDAHLSGTYKLAGNQFIHTLNYFIHYLNQLPIEPSHAEFIKELQYLREVEQALLRFKHFDINQLPSDDEELLRLEQGGSLLDDINQFASKIENKLFELPEGKRLLLPGGWRCLKGSGHAMIYALTRTSDGFQFRLFNAGSGIEYHEQKSSLEKHLYNPTKTWQFPLQEGKAERGEIARFIRRLLEPRILALAVHKEDPFCAKKLYEKTFASISYIQGVQIPSIIPDFAYTGGSLSSTCTQRCLQQLSKVYALSEKDHVRFIFHFKQFALFDYVNTCLKERSQEYTPAVKQQITLAIKNNLRIVNNPNAFTQEEITDHVKAFEAIKQQLKNTAFTTTPSFNNIASKITTRKLICQNTTTLHPNLLKLAYKNPLPSLDQAQRWLNTLACIHNITTTAEPLNETAIFNFIDNLKVAVSLIRTIKSFALRYDYLELLISRLPLSFETLFKSMETVLQVKHLDNHISTIQTQLTDLQTQWLKDSQSPTLNVMILSIVYLQMSIKEELAKRKKLPSYSAFVKQVIHNIVRKTQKNPFYATNQPFWDIRFKWIQNEIRTSDYYQEDVFCNYLKDLCATEASITEKANELYIKHFGSENNSLHKLIRSRDLGAIYALTALNIEKSSTYKPLIDKIQVHCKYEENLRHSIAHFFERSYQCQLTITESDNNDLIISSPLYAHYIRHQTLSVRLTKDKYAQKDSPAHPALVAYGNPNIDSSTNTANSIQLEPDVTANEQTMHVMTEEGIRARDYFHLRLDASIQIALTLDYFTHHFDALTQVANQRYVEANLFEPGLLANALQKPDFFKQFDTFLKEGTDFFNKKGQYTTEPLFFLYLNYQVSHYAYLLDSTKDDLRLKKLQSQLQKQLALPNNSEESTYCLQQLLFQTLMTRIVTDDFQQIVDAYFYLQNHSNHGLFEDTSNRIAMEVATARFQMKTLHLQAKISDILIKSPLTQQLTFKEEQFPLYTFTCPQGKHKVINVLLGQIIEDDLAQAHLPLRIRNHPLIKHLQLENEQTCLVSSDEKYRILNTTPKVYLFVDDNRLTVQKDWDIQDEPGTYELQPLSKKHLAHHANNQLPLAQIKERLILTDKTMDYWQHTTKPIGLLVRNGLPCYLIRHENLFVLDDNGRQSAYHCISFDNEKAIILLNSFESSQFIIGHALNNHRLFKLPRYGLEFETNQNQDLTYSKTGETLVPQCTPIHPLCAGLVLADETGNRRFIVPVTRFYATTEYATVGAFYPVVHDIDGTIAKNTLAKEWAINPPKQKPLWDYQNSEQIISFRLQKDKPVADTTEKALYLAYLYLATYQPKKAWKLLEQCNTHLGGLTGSAFELQMVYWICKALPHVFDKTEQDEETINTPPYLACKLKAIHLVCDFLSQDKTFTLTKPSLDGSANSHYARLEHNALALFRYKMTIFQSIKRFQTMARHQEHRYSLSMLERKRLLDFYHKNDQPLYGAAGYEYRRLNSEAITLERNALLLRKQNGLLSIEDNNRLQFTQWMHGKLKPAYNDSLSLKQVFIDLETPDDNHPFPKVPYDAKTPPIDEAIQALSSEMVESDFIKYFWTYHGILISKSDTPQKRKVEDFCINNMLANRSVYMDTKEANIPLLCNILYKVGKNAHLEGDIVCNFTSVINSAKSYAAPQLETYEVQNDDIEIPLQPEPQLTNEPLIPNPLVLPTLKNTALLEQETIKNTLNKPQHQKSYKQLKQYLSQYRQIHEQTTIAITKKSTDEEAGKIRFNAKQQQQALAVLVLKSPECIDLIMQLIACSPALLNKAQGTWDKAIQLANQGPKTAELAQQWRIEKLAKTRAPLTKKMLLAMYVRAEASFSMEQTGLSHKKCQNLHNLTHQALIESIQSQCIANISLSLENAVETHDVHAIMQALDILSKKALPGLNKPTAIIIQYKQNILLRPHQIKAIQALVRPHKKNQGFQNLIEKIEPGQGKSSTIVPVVVEDKARGDNLVIVIVPAFLLATNKVDFNRTSQRLFGKRAYCFEFNRDSNCSATRLEQLYRQFIEVVTTRCYLISTAESMQALELKYLELLLTDNKETHWKEQIFWCDKLLTLIRNYGDCLIDEVHHCLSLKKKLNYTFGSPIPLGDALIRNAVLLFNLLDRDFIKKAPSLPNTYDWNAFKSQLATQVINNQSSPLYAFAIKATKRLGGTVPNELIAYLTNTCDTMPDAVFYASEQEKTHLAFFKQQISVIIPNTLTRKLHVDYGPSQRSNLRPVETTIAIPYAGNDNPCEKNRFGNELEAITLTLQMTALSGINKALFKEQIILLQALARQELLQNEEFTHINQTPTVLGFALLEHNQTRFSLDQINPDDSEQIDHLFSYYQFNKPLLSNILQERILKQIHYDGAVLHSNAFDHSAMYRSVQGLSGTPEGTRYARRLGYNPLTSKGTEDCFFEVLLSKQTPISTHDCLEPQAFIHSVLTQSADSSNTRVFTDINATFSGFCAQQIAQGLATCIQHNPNLFNNPIKYVLYADSNDVLCALPTNNPQKPIIIGSSNEEDITRLLGITPAERFTFYDERHTQGLDIKQDKKAHAIVFADDKTTYQAFVQGGMRMRGIEQKQTMEIVLPKRLKGITLQTLKEQLKGNSDKNKGLERLAACNEAITNLVRNLFLTLIRDNSSDDAMITASITNNFKPFIVTTSCTDLVALYGAPSKKLPPETILNTYKKQVLLLWETCCQKEVVGMLAEKNETFKANLNRLTPLFAHKLESIIRHALPECLSEYDSANTVHNQEVQIQKIAQKQVQIERLNLIEWNNPSLLAAPIYKWGESDKPNDIPMTIAINTIPVEEKNLFSKNLRLSYNFSNTYQDQKELYNRYLKPVFLIWYHLEENVLHATIITPHDIVTLASKNSWIATTNDTVIIGEVPHDITMDPTYQALREQVRFFNGELKHFLNPKTPIRWLNVDTDKKITFFQDNLLRYRAYCEADFQQLKMLTQQSSLYGYNYIFKHAFTDFTDCDWLALLPQSSSVHFAEYQQLANALTYLNKQALTKVFSLDEIQREFSLPVYALTYVKKHLDTLLWVRTFIDNIINNTNTDFFTKLLDEDKLALEKCFGLPLEHFHKQCTVYQDSNLTLLSAKIEALRLLESNGIIQDKKALTDYLIGLIAHAPKDFLLQLLHNPKYPETLLIALLSDKFLGPQSIQTLHDEAFNTLLTTSMTLPENYLLPLIARCKTKENLITLLKRNDLKAEALIHILFQNTLDAKHTQLVLESLDKSFTPDIAHAIILQCDTHSCHGLLKQLTQRIAAHYKEAQGPEQYHWEARLKQLITKYARSTIDKQRDWLVSLKNNLKQNEISPELGCAILRDMENPDVSHLPLETMLNNNDKTLELLFKADNLPPNYVTSLASQCTNEKQKAAWLTRHDVTEALLQDLFTQDDAILHKNWTKSLQDYQSQLKLKSSTLLTNDEQLQLASEQLKVQAGLLVLHAVHDQHYKTVAKTAVTLSQGVSKALTAFKQDKQVDTFHGQCMEQYGAAKGVISQHRGYKQIFVDILNAILTALNLCKIEIPAEKWRFFEPKTNTLEETDTIFERLGAKRKN